MHAEKTVKPARRKVRQELAAALTMIALLITACVDLPFSNWMLDHAGPLIVTGIGVWGIFQMRSQPHSL
jgi:hypothetical protein